MDVLFTPNGWKTYQYWQQEDQKSLDKINQLIKEICRTPFKGSGKPELLKHKMSGKWSRRINNEHRLIYSVIDGKVTIYSCRFHY